MKVVLLRQVERAFARAVAVWVFFVSLGLCLWKRELSLHLMRVFGTMALASALDLWFLAQAAWAVIAVIEPQKGDEPWSQKWVWLRIRAFFWASIKLACVGFLILLLARTQTPDWGAAILGLSTLFAVPVLGGVFWARTNRDTAKRAR